MTTHLPNTTDETITLFFTGLKYHLYSYTNLPYVFGVISRLSCLLQCSDCIFTCWYHVLSFAVIRHFQTHWTVKRIESRTPVFSLPRFSSSDFTSLLHLLIFPSPPPSFFSFALSLFPLNWSISIKPLTSVIFPVSSGVDLRNKQGHLQIEPCGHYHK